MIRFFRRILIINVFFLSHLLYASQIQIKDTHVDYCTYFDILTKSLNFPANITSIIMDYCPYLSFLSKSWQCELANDKTQPIQSYLSDALYLQLQRNAELRGSTIITYINHEDCHCFFLLKKKQKNTKHLVILIIPNAKEPQAYTSKTLRNKCSQTTCSLLPTLLFVPQTKWLYISTILNIDEDYTVIRLCFNNNNKELRCNEYESADLDPDYYDSISLNQQSEGTTVCIVTSHNTPPQGTEDSVQHITIPDEGKSNKGKFDSQVAADIKFTHVLHHSNRQLFFGLNAHGHVWLIHHLDKHTTQTVLITNIPSFTIDWWKHRRTIRMSFDYQENCLLVAFTPKNGEAKLWKIYATPTANTPLVPQAHAQQEPSSDTNQEIRFEITDPNKPLDDDYEDNESVLIYPDRLPMIDTINIEDNYFDESKKAANQSLQKLPEPILLQKSLQDSLDDAKNLCLVS